MAIGDLLKKKEKKAKGAPAVPDDGKKTRDLPKGLNAAVSVILFCLGLYHLYIAFFGANSAMELRATHWTALAAACGVYILCVWQRIAVSGGSVNTADIVFGCLAVLVVLEATRRAVGPVLALVAAVFLAYAFLGHMIPGVMGHRAHHPLHVHGHRGHLRPRHERERQLRGPVRAVRLAA